MISVKFTVKMDDPTVEAYESVIDSGIDTQAFWENFVSFWPVINCISAGTAGYQETKEEEVFIPPPAQFSPTIK